MVDPVQCRLGFGPIEGLRKIPFYFMRFISMEVKRGVAGAALETLALLHPKTFTFFDSLELFTFSFVRGSKNNGLVSN